MLSPFVFLGFYTVDYIYSGTYTLLQSETTEYSPTSFSGFACTQNPSLSFPFDLRTLVQPPKLPFPA